MTDGPEYRPPGQDPYPPVDYPAAAGMPPPLYPPGYPAPGYPPPGPYPGWQPYAYDPYRPTRPPGTNGKAIGALVSALAGLFCCGLPSVVGLILGVIAMRETRRTGQEGWGMALAGTIIGGVVTVGWLMYLLLFVGMAASNWPPYST
jgi:hypothetical protein